MIDGGTDETTVVLGLFDRVRPDAFERGKPGALVARGWSPRGMDNRVRPRQWRPTPVGSFGAPVWILVSGRLAEPQGVVERTPSGAWQWWAFVFDDDGGDWETDQAPTRELAIAAANDALGIGGRE